jgi:hypothetical protein
MPLLPRVPMFRNLSFCESNPKARARLCQFKFCLTERFRETKLNWLDQLKAHRITRPMMGQRMLSAPIKR